MVIAMVEHEAFGRLDITSFKQVQVGGTTITPAFVNMVRARLGCEVQVIFGQTECGGEIAKTLRGEGPEDNEGTVGFPHEYTDIKIADAQTGETKGRNEVGEIRVRSPFVCLGYFGDEQATRDLFDRDGYLRTGDLGMIDSNGRVSLTGRLKEMIIRGGENIYPREIEDALGEMPSVVECAVFGVPHERWGEEVAVAVRTSDPEFDLAAAREFLLSRIARHKVPKHWRLVDDFPRNSSGKTQKFELQRLFEHERGEVA
jgi:fatty-acyl-CoA synthase